MNATRFADMLVRVSLPLIIDGSDNVGNWELSMIEGMLGIAVFTENETLLAHAMEFWKQVSLWFVVCGLWVVGCGLWVVVVVVCGLWFVVVVVCGFWFLVVAV